MSIEVHCTSCTLEFHVTGEFSGKLIRCPSCKDPVRVPDVAPAASQPEISQSSKSSLPSTPSQSPRKQARRSAPARPTQPRPAASRSARRDSSYESRSRSQSEAPRRRSAKSDVVKRNRRKQAQGDFPVGLAVGLGVGIAGLLIAVVVFMNKGPEDSLIASTDEGSSPAAGLQQDQDNFNQMNIGKDSAQPTAEPFSTPNSAASISKPASDYQQPPAVAINQNLSPPLTNYLTSPDTSGLPSSSRQLDSPSLPNKQPGSASASGPDTIGASVPERPPIMKSWSDVNAIVGPSIVRVDVKLSGGGGQGSGYVVDAEKGVVVTNYHVIEGALDAQISFENGDRIHVDGFLFLDSKRDIAMLKFDPLRSTQAKLRGLPLAKAHPLKGEEVAAFGAPVGLDFSMTQNIISAIRSAKDMAKMIGLTDVKGTWLQHGVSISSGNSGGPLINKRGEVVGMNTLGLTIGQNLNFAISGLDVTEGFNSQLPKMLAVSPSSAPVRHRSGSSGPDGSFDDPYERPEIQIVDVAGEKRGEELLAKMKSLTILSIAFTADPSGTVTGAVRSEARKTIDRCKIKLTSSRGADYVMLMVMHLEQSGNKSTLRMTSQILTKDDDAREVLKIWELTEDVGTLSMLSIARRYLPPNLKNDIKKYFGKVRSELIGARRKYGSNDDSNN